MCAGDQQEPGSRKALGEVDSYLKAPEIATGRDDTVQLLLRTESDRREALLQGQIERAQRVLAQEQEHANC